MEFLNNKQFEIVRNSGKTIREMIDNPRIENYIFMMGKKDHEMFVQAVMCAYANGVLNKE